MALLDYLFPPQQNTMMGLLGGDEEKMRQAAQRAGLLNTGLGIIAASGPSNRPQGLLQPVASGLMAGQQAYQGVMDQQVQNQLNAAKFAEVKRKADVQKLLPTLFTETTDAQGNKVQIIDQNKFQQLMVADPEIARNIATARTEARKAGLFNQPSAQQVNPFEPFLASASPAVKTTANRMAQAYKEGRLTEEQVDTNIRSLASMDEGFATKQVYQELARVNLVNAQEKNAAAKDGKPLPPKVITDLAEQSDQVSRSQRLQNTFKDNFGGFAFDTVGDAAIAISKRSSDPARVEFSQWWQDYQAYKNEIRNKLFGSALTATEKGEFEKAQVTPGMNPEQIKANLARQSDIAQRAYNKITNAYLKGGYSASTIESLNPANINALLSGNQPQGQPQAQATPAAPQVTGLPEGVKVRRKVNNNANL